MEKYYTSKEVCDLLHISKITLDRICMAGKIGYSRPGNARMFRQQDIEAYLERGRKHEVA